ncbi:MAG: hypothetical protein OES39_04200, partial [Desulfobulbaceae bacterium]|nr:hypothetical protein [Desulfobulbaceae bacterium]
VADFRFLPYKIVFIYLERLIIIHIHILLQCPGCLEAPGAPRSSRGLGALEPNPLIIGKCSDVSATPSVNSEVFGSFLLETGF